MALTVQNLRAVGTGVEPASLLPGQICFNVTDKVIYVGDGTNFKTNFDGTQVTGVPGEGWYAMPMDFTALNDYYVANPGFYGDVPTDQQVLTWSTALNHPIWTSGGGGGGGNQVYVVTNAAVASASGATTSDKITAAIGVASPDEGDVTIVTGLPDDVYEGLYFFTTEWVKGAAYAYPSATEVIYDNTVTGLTPTVQGAIDDLDAGLTATTAIANTANSTANSALSIANAALPKAGGTMVGTIVARNIDVQSGYGVLFSGGASGTINGITDAVTSTSSTLAASANGLRFTYDIANAALQRSGGTMTGTITFAAGQIFPVSGIQDATAAQKGVVQIGSNIQVAAGVISVADGTITGKGVVQMTSSLITNSPTLALTAAAGYDLQQQIDAITLASNVTLAGSINATTGLLDSVTTQGAGAGFVAGSALPAAAAGNADYYVLVTIAGSYSPPGGGGPYTAEPGDWFLSDGTSWQYLGVGARPQSATYTTAGIVQLADTAVTYTGTSDTEAVTPNSLQDKVTDSISTTDSNLIASATAVKAAYDIGAAAIPCGTITAVGDILVGGAGPAPTALPVGTDGQVLVANSACATGLEWVSDTPGDVTSVSGTAPITVDNTDPQNPIVGIDAASTTQPGAVQLDDTVISTSTTEAATANAAKTAYDKGVDACTVAQAAVPCASFTALGELLAGTGAGTYSALPVGSDGQFLAANSVTGTGLEWCTLSLACVPCSAYTAIGTILAGTGAGTYCSLPVGTDGQTLIADSTCAEGVKWGAAFAGFTTGTPSFNTAYGCDAGTNLASGIGNVLIGANAGRSQTNATSVVAIGYNAGCSITSGSSNIAIGSNALCSTTSNTQNIAIGSSALCRTQGVRNTAVGYNAGCSSTGSDNTLFGNVSGRTLSTGTDNTFLGYASGCGVTTGSNNVIIGAYSGTAALTSNVVLSDGTGAVRFQANQNGAWSPDGTNYGTVGQVLISNGTVGVPTWGDACYVPDACFTAIGDIVIGTGAGTYAALPVGTDGQALLADSACAEGVKWGEALVGLTTADNTALGVNTLPALTTGVDNTVIGVNTGATLTAGSRNVLIGDGTGDGLAAGNNNTAVGFNAFSGTGGSNNTMLGACAGCSITSGNSNTVIGAGAGDSLTGANAVVAIGQGALRNPATATGTVAIGQSALASLTSGTSNTAVGYQAGDSLSSGSVNTLFGFNAGAALTLGGTNILLGANAGDSITTGFNNTIIGDVSGSASLVGNLILAAGTTVKFQANDNGAWSPDGTNYGTTGQVLTSAGTGGVPTWSDLPSTLEGYTDTATPFNTAYGANAGDSITTGTDNVALGYNAGTAQAAGSQSVFIGSGAGQTTNATGVTAIGFCAAQANTTVGCGTYLGYVSGRNATGLSNTYVGALTGCAASNSSACGTLLGFCAGAALTTGNANTFVGFNTGRTTSTGAFNTAMGAAAFQSGTGSCNTAMGCGALAGGASGAGNVAIGHRAMLNTSSGAANVAIGLEAGSQISTGACNVAVGFCSLTAAAGVQNVALGAFTGGALTGSNNTLVGFCAGGSATAAISNTFLGYFSGRNAVNPDGNVGVGYGTLCAVNLSGSYNVAIGYNAGSGVINAGANVLIGYTAGQSITTGSFNTIVGRYTGSATLSNNVVLADGQANVRFQANATGAWSPDGTNYGAAGQFLTSAGTGAVPAWSSSLPQVTAPTASTDAGNEGEIASDATYFYMYTGGRWQRVAWDATAW